MFDPSIPAVLRTRAQAQPNDIAFNFIDYEVDPAGFEERLTWSELYRRVQVVAHELLQSGSVGDRVAILAPQSFDYIVGLLGALEAGLIAVPLPVPMLGLHDERVSGVLKDCAPVAVITTSAAVDAVMPSLSDVPGSPLVIEVDALDFDSPPPPFQTPQAQAKIAFLQYTSGSTRAPAGVVVTHENLIRESRDRSRPTISRTPAECHRLDTTLVSWLPFYHDMGLMLGIFGPIAYGFHAVLTSPMAFLQKPARWMQLVARNHPPRLAGAELRVRTGCAADVRRGYGRARPGARAQPRHGSERIHASTLRRFTDRFSPFNLPDTALRPAYGLAEATVYVASALLAARRRPPVSTTRSCRPATRSAAQTKAVSNWSAMVRHAACTVRIVDPETCIENPAGKVGEIWVHGDNVAAGYWRNPQQSELTFGGRLSTRRRTRRRDPGCGPETSVSYPTANSSSSAGSRTC